MGVAEHTPHMPRKPRKAAGKAGALVRCPAAAVMADSEKESQGSPGSASSKHPADVDESVSGGEIPRKKPKVTPPRSIQSGATGKTTQLRLQTEASSIRTAAIASEVAEIEAQVEKLRAELAARTEESKASKEHEAQRRKEEAAKKQHQKIV